MTEPGHKAAPRRACIACRQRRPTDRLIRFVAGAGELVPDLRRTLPGRGAHLCASRACLGRAVKRRSFGRALRTSVHVELDALQSALGGLFESETQRLATASRARRSDLARVAWFEQGLREFTLGTPGAMNRGPAKRGLNNGPEDLAEQRSGNR